MSVIPLHLILKINLVGTYKFYNTLYIQIDYTYIFQNQIKTKLCECYGHTSVRIFKTIVNSVDRNGCATSEDMLWKLDALQSFIRELHWPDEMFADHLDHRLKLMAADMIEAAAKRSEIS